MAEGINPRGCAACGETIRRGSYSWTMGWSRAWRDYGGPGKKAFSVRFHNKPECISIMTERLDGYVFDQRMAAAFENMDWGDDEDAVEFYEVKET